MRTEFDNTMLCAYQTCQRKYNFRHNMGLTGKARQYAPEFGQAIHKALDCWYKTRNVESSIDIFKNNFMENPEDDPKRTHKMGVWILNNYFEKYKDQPHKLIQCEQAFSLPLPNGNTFIGRIDKIVEWCGDLWVMDHKTTSELGASYFKKADPNLQFTGYTWAARQLGYNVVGVIVDAVLVAKGLLESSSRARLTPLSRYDLYRSQEHLDEWFETVNRIITHIQVGEKADYWIPNFDACTYYGECPYRRICVEDKAVRPRIIEAEYIINHWDPRKEQ